MLFIIYLLKQLQDQQSTQKLIWDEIDAEIRPLSEEQKFRLLQNPEYADVYSRLQGMVQNEIINLVKGRIENSQEGKDLLTAQLNLVRKLKGHIVEETNKEMEVFRKFKEYSKQHPDARYEDFIKDNM